MVAVGRDGMVVATKGGGATAEHEALNLWLEAMHWLEPLQPPGEREVEAFAGALGDSLAEDDEILAALLALAHAPMRRAYEVLEGYAQAPHPGMGHLARLACEEWLFWCERTPLGDVA